MKVYLDILNIIEEELGSKDYNSDISNLIKSIYQTGKVFIAGAGRSKMVANMFAMRLMHCGYGVHIIGDATTPSISKFDLFLIVSNSGETSQLVDFAKRAKGFGAKIILITANKESTIGSLADHVIQIGSTPRNIENVLPLGGRFELSTLIFLESVIIEIMKDNDLIDEDLAAVHANLE